jgi:virginiamycin A acetyltransferase
MKSLLKLTADAIATLLVLPAWLLYRMAAIVMGTERAFPGWSQGMSLIPGLCGVYLRRAFYRLVFPECGAGTVISFGTVFSHPTARLGRNVYLGVYCSIGDVTLGDDVLVASHVSIINGGSQHAIDRVDVPIREQTGSYPRITIGRGAWIGERSVVMADVGRDSIIGAGAVVTKPVEERVIAAGVPCRVIRRRTVDEERDPTLLREELVGTAASSRHITHSAS